MVAGVPSQLSLDTSPETPGNAAPHRDPRAPSRPPERYRVAEAAELLGITPGALRRRAAAGAIAIERPEYDEDYVTKAELARHVAEYTPSPGGRPASLPNEVVERIEALRSDGLSYARIAALLTLDDVPTAHGADRWWPSSVRAVLMRRERADPTRG
jgi:hypothetical protein